MEEDYDYLFKIIIIGDSSVGKSSIISKFVDNEYNDVFMSTIGVDLNVKFVKIDGKTIKLQLWEIAGHERFRNIVSAYYRNCQGIILTFDVTNKESFENIQNWIGLINKNNTEYNDIPEILVGNKNDLKSRRAISYEEASEYSCDLNIPYIECSAKNGENIHDVFDVITKAIKTNSCLQNMKSFEQKISSPKKERSCCFMSWFSCCR